nr:MAG TPA: hypothetical protein [Bacteriophage sp.]
MGLLLFLLCPFVEYSISVGIHYVKPFFKIFLKTLKNGYFMRLI